MSDINRSNTRNYTLARINFQVSADLTINDHTFAEKFKYFQVNGSGEDLVSVFHHFTIAELDRSSLGKPIYNKPPWAIFCIDNEWIYFGILPEGNDNELHRMLIINDSHSVVHVYSPGKDEFLQGNIHTLTMLPTDQIIIARLLADRQGCYLHAAGMILDGQGLLFVGHSEAGKSTMVTMLQYDGEILCDDRMIVRHWPEGFRIHGTWSHGDVPVVSPNSAPLRAILLLEQAPRNQLIPISDHREIVRILPFFVVKPLVTVDWWEKTLDLVGRLAREVPFYRLQFDKSGGVRQVLKELY
jgi:hypothetical protein